MTIRDQHSSSMELSSPSRWQSPPRSVISSSRARRKELMAGTSEVFNAETFIIGLCSGVLVDPRIQKAPALRARMQPLPRGTGYPAHHSGRHHPGSRRSHATPSKPCALSKPQRSHSRYPFRSGGRDTGIFSAYFCSGPSVQLVSILHENALFCSKSYKRVRSFREDSDAYR